MHEASKDGGNEQHRDQFVRIAALAFVASKSNLFNCVVSQIIQGLGSILYSLMTVSKQVHEVNIRNNREEPGTQVNKIQYPTIRKKYQPSEFRIENS